MDTEPDEIIITESYQVLDDIIPDGFEPVLDAIYMQYNQGCYKRIQCPAMS